MHTVTAAPQSPAHDPSIDFWAQRRAEESRRAYLTHQRRTHAQRVQACVDAWIARNNAELQQRAQAAA